MGWVGRLEGVDMCARVSENARTVVVVVVGVVTVVDQVNARSRRCYLLLDAWSESWRLSMYGYGEDITRPTFPGHVLYYSVEVALSPNVEHARTHVLDQME